MVRKRMVAVLRGWMGSRSKEMGRDEHDWDEWIASCDYSVD